MASSLWPTLGDSQEERLTTTRTRSPTVPGDGLITETAVNAAAPWPIAM
jgi:hypothetical protein